MARNHYAIERAAASGVAILPEGAAWLGVAEPNTPAPTGTRTPTNGPTSLPGSTPSPSPTRRRSLATNEADARLRSRSGHQRAPAAANKRWRPPSSSEQRHWPNECGSSRSGDGSTSP